MNKLDVVKLAARLVVGAGTTTVTNSIIRNNVTPTNLIEQISVGVTSVVIGSMASNATREYTVAQIDSFAAVWNDRTKSTEPTPTA